MLLAASSAIAQPSDADILFRRVAELRQSGQYEAALRLATQAAEREDGPRAQGEIALCEVAMERWVAAETHLVAALAAPDDPWVSRRRLTLDGTLADVRQHLARVEFVRGPEGARVEVGGVALGVLPFREPVRVASGNVEIVVRAPGYREYRRAVQLFAGATHFEEVLMEPLQAAARQAPTAPPACGPGLVLRAGLCYAAEPAEGDDGGVRAGAVLLWGGAAATLVAAATAIGLGADGDRIAQGYIDRCATVYRPDCAGAYADAQQTLDGRAPAVNALIAVALVSAAVSVTGLVLELGARRRRPPVVALRVLPGAVRVSW